MNHVTKLACCLLLLIFMASPALAALQPGSYVATSEGRVLTITLRADGNGYFEGETNNPMKWTQEGPLLFLTFYGEEGGEEFSVAEATITGLDSFVLGKQEYRAASAVVQPDLRGPRVHGLQLGMSCEKAVRVMDAIAREYGQPLKKYTQNKEVERLGNDTDSGTLSITSPRLTVDIHKGLVSKIVLSREIFHVDMLDDDFIIGFCDAYGLDVNGFTKTRYSNNAVTYFIYEYKDREEGFQISTALFWLQEFIVLESITRASEARFR